MCMYYLAYGSNLNIEQMKYRCSDAKVVGKTVLSGWRLRFRGTPNNAVATIEPAEGCSVPVGVWQISQQDETALDVYEGYPNFYRKETLTVTLDGHSIQAFAYIMNKKHRYNEPCFDYIKTILDGYTAFGLDKEILREALTLARGMNFYDRKG